MERRSICFPRPGTKSILEQGNDGFNQELRRLYATDENNALEMLVDLKSQLRTLSAEDFWSTATEGLSKLLGAEITFIMKRILVDDHDCAVEMPPIGEPGSCLMAAALHYCTVDGTKHTVKETKFHAYGCPCAYMRHDKVFVIPEGLSEFITNNPNQVPFPCEAYIAVPLFVDGKCVAHFGAMWSKPSAAERKLSWAFIEMLLHSLEDMMVQRLIEGSNFVKQIPAPEKPRVIPHDVVTVAQSLRPYAGSLSHELRTPMQGVVGMLDVMYATVHEAVEASTDPHLRKIFQNLKENIEVVQDSSRRAVEAADNVVHAYDMDMSVPDGPVNLPTDESSDMNSPFSSMAIDRRPEILVAGSNLPLARPNKRRREEFHSESRNGSNASHKVARVENAISMWTQATEASQGVKDGLYEAEEVQAHSQPDLSGAQVAAEVDLHANVSAQPSSSRVIVPGLRHTDIREVLRYVINEGLKLGGRPDVAMATETDLGESIEVRTRGSDGSASRKIIEWSVDPSLPHTFFMDEKDLSKLISCVFLNAIKFTDQTDGRVGVHARMSSRGRYLSIKISDNGPGIPAAFLPKLFKPFSQQNGSLTRQSEGLGLGLMVAKGIARKLGGDLMCIHAETKGPNHGSEFEIKVPIKAGEIISRPASPFTSPMPRRATLATSDGIHSPAFPSGSPRALTKALHEAVDSEYLSCRDLPSSIPGTPPSPHTTPYLEVPPQNGAPPTPTPEPANKPPRPRARISVSNPEIDSNLAAKYPLTFLVAEDNKINRKLLVTMLSKLGYRAVFEAHDGVEAVRQMTLQQGKVDIILMDLWMPHMSGLEAAERILGMQRGVGGEKSPTVLAVTADVTDGALESAARVGMKGYMTKPFKLVDLQRLITEYCAKSQAEVESWSASSMVSA